MSKPIVAFDLTENRYTAQQAAVFVPANDERAFARALTDLMDDPEQQERMGAFGRRRIEESLAWTHWSPKLLDVYEQLFAKQGATAVSHS